MLGTGPSMTKEKLVPFTNNLTAPPKGRSRVRHGDEGGGLDIAGGVGKDFRRLACRHALDLGLVTALGEELA